jgi:hypothetical protein
VDFEGGLGHYFTMTSDDTYGQKSSLRHEKGWEISGRKAILLLSFTQEVVVFQVGCGTWFGSWSIRRSSAVHGQPVLNFRATVRSKAGKQGASCLSVDMHDAAHVTADYL